MREFIQPIQKYFKHYPLQLVVLSLEFFGLSLGSIVFHLPIAKTTILFIVWLAAVWLLKLTGRLSVIGGLVLLGTAPFLLILANGSGGEGIANLAFGLLVIGMTQEFIEYLRENKKSGKEA